MADRAPGLYWVRHRDHPEEWSIAQWVFIAEETEGMSIGWKWKKIGNLATWEDYHFIEIGERIEHHEVELSSDKKSDENRRNSISGEELRERMTSPSLSRNDLARRIGVSESIVKRWMNGRYAVPYYVEYILNLIQRNNYLEETLHDVGLTRAELSPRRKKIHNPYLDNDKLKST